MKKAVLGPNCLKAIYVEKENYQEMTGSLIFTIVETRPDIAFFITVTTCFAKNPSHAYTETVKTIFCYLKRLINYSIIYGCNREDLSIKSYLDTNWAGDKES